MAACRAEGNGVYFLVREAVDVHLSRTEGRGRRQTRRNRSVIRSSICKRSLRSKRINSSRTRRRNKGMGRREGEMVWTNRGTRGPSVSFAH